MELDLPDLVCHKIVEVLSAHGVLQLTAVAGISRQWRSTVRNSRYHLLSFESDLKLLREQKNRSFDCNVLSDKHNLPPFPSSFPLFFS